MDFSMLCWKNASPFRMHRRRMGRDSPWLQFGQAIVLGLFFFLAAGQNAHATRAVITDAHAEIREDVLYLDADLTIDFDAEMIAAMRNAIPLNLTLQAVIEEPRDWWVPRTIASDDRRYRLEYHALSKTWLLTDILEHEARSYSTLDGAVRSLQRVRAWPICSARHLVGTAHLVGRVRLVLDVNKLPLPLRFPALFDSRWALDSDWFLWSVPRP